ncbi:MAG: zinc ribbon domain-containing protein [Actinobacteria bacterium]|jgi:putative FmdB family regulatory protein|nr:MAG: zinc ribbon domain-containing protein [Actinomycetota bacterium]
MPFYEYRCEDCGEKFEYFARSMGDEAECCAACGKKKIRKLLSVFGFKSGSAASGDFHSSAGSSACGSCTASSCTGCSN